MKILLDLSGKWKLRAEMLDVGVSSFQELATRMDGPFKLYVKPDTKRRLPSRTGSIEVIVPCDVITPLVENGLLDEPLLKTNSDGCMWIGDLSWWFVRDFDLSDEEYMHEELRLFIETLDYNADIFVNNRHLANHKNAFRPFKANIKRFVTPGKNRIIIRLTTGYELHGSSDSLTLYNNSGYGQRVYLRKPQFTHGWDWCKPIPTCGIGGKVCIEGVSGAGITAFRCDTLELTREKACLEFAFELENLSMVTADDAVLYAELSFDGKIICSFEQELYLSGGVNFFAKRVELEHPCIWWPNGSGEQPLYELNARVECRGFSRAMESRMIGVRTVKVDMDKYPDGTRKFDFMVNGQKIFMKGGNWIPADSVYLRVTKEKYETLIREAAACGSNMLRVWGGGLYEPDCFYDACSQYGILVMQDFMYACGFYPDHLDWFMHEASLEAEYQTKRLGFQPCLAVWTGNNEIHESFSDWYKNELQPEILQGASIWNGLLPKVVKANTPNIHYMPSSPFYGNKANDPLAGDCHLWNAVKFKFFYELEAFDEAAGRLRFSSEYGFYGALKRSSVERYHDGEPVSLDGAIWIHHGERASKHRLIDPMLLRHVMDPQKLDLDRYLLYTGIAQGLLYEELTISLRRRAHCSGQLIWMYNDCWPETGWSVIDYYLTRKNSFYFLKRSFASKFGVVRVMDGVCGIVFANESGQAWQTEVEYGYMSFDGKKSETRIVQLDVPAFGRVELDGFAAEGDLSEGLYYALPSDTHVPALSLRAYFRDVRFPDAQITLCSVRQENGCTVCVVRSDVFAPVIEIAVADDSAHMSDNYFPLLPGVEKEVVIDGIHEAPAVRAIPFDYLQKIERG